MNNHIKHLPNGDFEVVPLTPEIEKTMDEKMDRFMSASEELRKAFAVQKALDETDAGFFWDSLSYEDKCNAFHAVVSRIYEGEIKVKGSYRYVLYDIFGFGPDMYVRGMDCGYMALHNSIMDDKQFNEANKWMCESEPSELDIEKDFDK